MIGNILMIVCSLSMANAQPEPKNKMNITLDTAYMTKYLSYGIDGFDDAAAASGTVCIDWGERGFYGGARYLASLAGGNAYDQYSRGGAVQLDYLVGYKNMLMEERACQLNYNFSYTYSDWGTIRKDGVKLVSGADQDMQELALDLRLTNLRPFGLIIVPRYEAAYIFEPYGTEGGMISNQGKWGFLHTAGAAWYFALAGVPITLASNIVYDDGAITGLHDWTRMVTSLSAKFKLPGRAGTISPAIYYQEAFKDASTSPAMDDDFYAVLTYSIKF